jgi:hypothetical protein
VHADELNPATILDPTALICASQIRLEPSEFLKEVSGTFAYIGFQPTDAVTSLTFVTNLRKHGPFGDVDGTPFSVPVPHGGGSIVALFGRGWDYIDAIGVYVRAW